MQKRKTIIIFAILALVIGFASITTILNITGRTSVGFDSEQFINDVIFTSSVLDGTDVTSETIKENGKKIEFTSRELTMPGEKVVLDYVVTNNSTQYAGRATVRVTKFNDEYLTIENTPMTFDLSPQSNEPGELIITLKKSVTDDTDIEIEIEIEVEPIYPEDVTTTTTTTTETTTTTDPEEEGKTKYQVTIDPAGGLYNGLPDVVTTEVVEGKEITLSKVTKENYIFRHWLVNDIILSGNKVTITQDTHIIAVWAETGDAVAKIEETLYLSIQSAFDDAKTDDIVELLKSTEEIATNDKKVTLDLKGYKVTGQIINDGNLTIVNGTIENENGSALINSGTLTIGNNSDEGVSITIPAIIGTNKGIENTGTFNFYDGYVQAKVWLDGEYNDIPTGYKVYVDHLDAKDCQKAYLVEQTPGYAVVMTKLPNIYYKNLQDAIRKSEIDKKPIYAIVDFEAAYELSVSEGSEILFDIAGYTVEFGYIVTNDGNLTLTNSDQTKGILEPSVTITNNGTLNIRDIKITETTSANVITNNSIVNVENSTLTGLDGSAIYNVSGIEINLDENTYLLSNKYALYNQSPNETTVSNGHIRGVKNDSETSHLTLDGNVNVTGLSLIYAVENNAGKVTIKGGNYSNSLSAIYNLGIMEIYGGTVTLDENSTSVAIRNAVVLNSIKRGTLTIYDVNISSPGTGISNDGELTIRNANINAKNTAISASSETGVGVAYIYGGEINSETSYAISACTKIYIYGGNFSGSTGIYLFNTTNSNRVKVYGIATISDATIEGDVYGIHAYYGDLTLKSGTVNGGTYGIYSQYESNRIVIGDSSKDVQNENPIVTGELYGFYSSSINTNSFYSGVIKGKTGSTNSLLEFNYAQKNYKIYTEQRDEYYYSYLIPNIDFIKNTKTGTEYSSLQTAVTDATSGDELRVIANAIGVEPVNIPKDKKIILDLNGYELKIPNIVTNNGELEIKDSSDNMNGLLIGATNSALGSFITNLGDNAKLTVTKAKITNFNGTSTYIISSGNIKIIDSYIYGTGDLIRCDTCTIEGSKLEAYNKAIDGDTAIITRSTIKASPSTPYSNYYLINATNLTITDSTLETHLSRDLINNISGNIIINNSTITGSDSAIRLSDGANLTILNNSSIISNKSVAIYTMGSKINTITIGEDDEDLSDQKPLIQGATYGISGSSTTVINFFDGRIRGKTEPTSTNISATPEATSIIYETENVGLLTYKTKYLKRQGMIVSYNGKEYNSLIKAIEDVDEEGTLEMLTDAIISYEWEVPSTKDITLDLKGFTVDLSVGAINRGTLNIVGSDGATMNKTTTGYLITNYNNLSISGIKINSSSTGIYNSEGVSSLTNTNIEVTGDYALYLLNGTLNITSSNIKAPSKTNYYALYTKAGTVNYNSGSITGYYPVYLTGPTTFYQNDGMISSSDTAVYVDSGSTFQIDKGTITSSTITNKGTFTINNGTINSYVDNRNMFYMNGGAINNTTNNYYGLYNNRGKAIVTAGQITSSYSYAIYNEGTFTLGVDNDQDDDITVIGETYGIYSYDNFYYYDGIIKGKTDRILHGAIVKIPSNKMIVYDTETNEENGSIMYHICYLAEKQDIVSIDGHGYGSFEEAIAQANDDDTILLIRDVKIVENINNTKNITIDLNGYDLYMVGTNVITNDGTLTITNSHETKKSNLHKINSYRMIMNNATLTLENINFSNVYYSTLSTMIINSGVLTARKINVDAISTAIGGGVLYIYDSNITGCQSRMSSCSAFSATQGTLTMERTTVYNPYYNKESYNRGVYISSDSEEAISISDSTIESLYSYQARKMNLHDNQFTGEFELLASKNECSVTSTDDTFKYIKSAVTLTLNNPTVTGSTSNSGTLTINGGNLTTIVSSSKNMYLNDLNITTTGRPIYISGSGENVLNRVTINSDDEVYITANATGTTTIRDSNITVVGTSDYHTYGLYVDRGSVNIVNSTIKASYAGTAKNIKVFGIYIINGDVTMGTQGDGEVSKEKPYIEAIAPEGSSGIGVEKVNGYFRFYDGKIVGSTNAKPDTTTLVEDQYHAVFGQTEEGYEYCILELL